MIPPQCPGCDRTVSQLLVVACDRCWRRLPSHLRHDVERTHDRYPATHRYALQQAVEWLQAHPWQPPQPKRLTPEQERLTPEQERAVLAHLEDAANMLNGTGQHADHERRQVGRCVYCSCGGRVQGRMGAST